jgi:hypothetical protein
MKEAAKQKYNDEVNDKDGVVEEEKTVDQDLIDAHIDVTQGMLEAIQTGNEDHQEHLKLKGLKDYGTSWALFDNTVEEITGNFHQSMKIVNREKMKVWTFCRQTLHDSELEAESKSVNFIRVFNSLRKHKIDEL